VIVTITAGGRVSGAFAEAIGTDVKALAVTGGRTLLDAALAAANDLEPSRIFVVGGAQVRARCPAGVVVLEESIEGRDNIRRAIATGGDEALLLLTSDTPFVDGSALADFVARAADFDVALPLASAHDYEHAYPGAPPHAVRLGRDRVVNGSAVLFGPGIGPRVLESAGRLFDARKSLVRMAALLGPALLGRFATGRLRVEHVEARAQAALGIRARAVRGCAPSLCFDIDSLEDYRYAQARFNAA
jgi:molybdopterin-guanine dinucleotide biosynthesis protein A